MNNRKYKIGIIGIISFLLITACEDFVDIETPDHLISSQAVFANDEMAVASITGIYNQLASADFSRGYLYSVTVLSGLSSDIFVTASATDTRYGPFQQNEISPIGSDDAAANYNLWSSAYNIIYMANSALEGATNSNIIAEDTKNLVQGQALFLRAFTYFYLVNLYGDVPLMLTTDYRSNALAARTPALSVWEQIEADLEEALFLLQEVTDYPSGERTYINRYAISALAARVHLYQQNWLKAEELSSEVIDQTSLFEVLDNLDQVFLKNSREAIWQISPLGRGVSATYTGEGYMYRGNNASPVKLSEAFVVRLPVGDKRSSWIGFNTSNSFYYPQKYKDGNSRNSVTEYSTVLRLAEQYLIRAEARAMQGNLSGAISDLDKIRGRAGLELLADINPGIGQETLLNLIMEERKKELFSEWGHRWLDLKRTAKAVGVLSPIKPLWQDTDVFYPIPGEERTKNPNLTQNEGY